MSITDLSVFSRPCQEESYWEYSVDYAFVEDADCFGPVCAGGIHTRWELFLKCLIDRPLPSLLELTTGFYTYSSPRIILTDCIRDP